MKIKEFKIVVAALGVATFTLQSCSKYEDGPSISLKSKKGRLTGEWELVDGSDDFDGIEVIIEFKKDGDFIWTSSYAYYGINQSYAFKGEWEWADGKTALEIDVEGDELDWEILKLSAKELTIVYYGDELEFEKQ